MIKISYEQYLDKVYGGWYGKCLGGAAGAPVEGIKKLMEIEDFKEIMNPELPNDDLDIQLLWLEVLEKKGTDISSCDLADAWMEKCWYPFSEYGYFIKNYKRGIRPPYSGRFNNPFFKEGMGCPIRSEIWGFIFPGNPSLAAHFAKLDGELDHADNSVWAEQFLAAVESMAFFEQNIRVLLELGLNYIPTDSKISECIRTVMNCHRNNQEDWSRARRKVLNLYSHPDFTNVTQNIGFVIIALLYGNYDLRKTINIALKCGYDADCTCATAGAVLGGILGYSNLGEDLKNLIQDYFVIGIDIKRKSNSIRELAADTCRLGVSIQEHMVLDTQITRIPDGLNRLLWPAPEIKPTIEIEYKCRPSIGYDDRAEFEIKLNNTLEKALKGEITINNIPEGWRIQPEKIQVNLLSKETAIVPCIALTSEKTSRINHTNLLVAALVDEACNELERYVFGIAGAHVWKAYGPFFEQLDKAPDPAHPSPHSEGCILPTVECMVNNAVYLDKEYIDESALSFDTLEYDAVINTYEDMIPVDMAFSMEGQCCFYLVQDIVSPVDQEVWAVIGNNDGFRFWVNGNMIMERDENRYWTPYNNCGIIKLKKGSNRLVLKLLRRTETLKLSFGLRYYEGEHYHRKQWITDTASII